MIQLMNLMDDNKQVISSTNNLLFIYQLIKISQLKNIKLNS